MNDSEIAPRLSLVVAVRTRRQGVQNDIVHVGTDHVIVRSSRTGTPRTIPFGDIRQAAKVTQNGVIARTLSSILGLA